VGFLAFKMIQQMKIISIDQLKRKKYKELTGLSDRFIAAHGIPEDRFVMAIYGKSGQGKSNYVAQVVKELLTATADQKVKLLYMALEEGHGRTIRDTFVRQELDAYSGRVMVAQGGKLADLMARLKKAKSPKIIVVDSVQYLGISYEEYKELKEMFPSKIFIFISHSSGTRPKGSTAEEIVYDANIKVRVHGFKALITSRYGSNENYIIWEEGARKAWKPKFYKKFHER
jgi:KaiC/GvpD/RAD55 family RecA-like ATPase